MRSPSQALLWSGLKLSWPPLLTQIIGVILVIFVMDLALDPETDWRTNIEAAELVLIVGLVFLFTTTLNRMQSTGRAHSALGFPFTLEFAYPVSTGKLIFVPLLFFCCLTQVAVFVPALLVNYLLIDVEVSYLPISFVLLQFTIVPLMLTWWTRSGLASLAGWLVAFYLYAYGYMLPDLTRVESSWLIEVESMGSYLVPSLITAALMALTYFGVRQQRSGESLFGDGADAPAGSETLILRRLVPLPASPCPVTSPLRAELWKEIQLNGGYRAIAGGLGGAGIILGVLGIISFFVPGESNILLSNVTLLIAAIYLSVCIALTVPVFGVRYRNGVSEVSVFDKTAAIGTARQTAIRISVCLSSVLITGVVLVAAVWLLGPLLITEMPAIRAQYIDALSSIAQLGFASASLRVILLLLAFLTGLLLFAIFLTWFMLQSKRMTAVVTGIGIYTFLLVNGIIAFTSDEEFYLILDQLGRGHLWLIILLIPAGILFTLRELMIDWVLSRSQLYIILAGGVAIQGLNLIWLFGSANYGALDLDIGTSALSYLIMQGFLPLLAVTLSLWTSARIRHG